MLLDYWYEHENFPFYWSWFAGDLFYDDFYFEIIELFYNFYEKIINNNPDYLQIIKEKAGDEYPLIVVPCNFSFCRDKSKIARLEQDLEKMKTLGITICFSYSGDGKYLTDTRERTDISDELYDEIFSLIARHPEFGCHPMVGACNISKWVENYDWWLDQYKKYFPDDEDFQPSMLEVRNDDWTEENIQDYLKFLEQVIKRRLELYNNDLTKFTASVIYFDPKKYQQYGLTKYTLGIDPIHMLPSIPGWSNHLSCDIGFSFIVNCYDLSIVPCHRLAYPHLKGGHFEVQQDKIVNIIADEGINAYFNAISTVPHYLPKCASCDYNMFCAKGCRGAQYEACGDYMVPILSVCNLFQAKWDFLFKRYHELGVFKLLFKTNSSFDLDDFSKNAILDFLIKKGYSEYEQYKS